jgi:NAD(P)-dependent dehydrogenase (short-subunit alcohol dehydrogenase family)
MTDQQAVAIVTGVSSGLGAAVAKRLVAGGYRVFGTVRSEQSRVPDGVKTVVLDVRDDASVASGVAAVMARAGRIDVLVNNAGGSMVGAIEETEIAQAQELFDVNFFGAVRVTRHVLPVMRKQRSGRVAFISSVLGFLPAPYMGFYAASKHALEGYCESLDHEVREFGVRAVLVEPGFMKTKIDANAARAAQRIGDYDDARDRVIAGIGANVEKGDDANVVADVVVAALRDATPHLRYTAGKGSATLSTLRRFLPRSLFDRSLRKEFRVDPAR